MDINASQAPSIDKAKPRYVQVTNYVKRKGGNFRGQKLSKADRSLKKMQGSSQGSLFPAARNGSVVQTGQYTMHELKKLTLQHDMSFGGNFAQTQFALMKDPDEVSIETI